MRQTTCRRAGAAVLDPPIELWVREEAESDGWVAREVISNDSYGVTELAFYGFRPATIVDVGSNIGAFATLALHYWPQVQLIAIEPDPRNIEIFRLNVKREAVQAAVCYGAPAVELYTSNRFPGCNYVNVPLSPHVVGRQNAWAEALPSGSVRAVTLEELAPAIDLLKLDCEGSEWNILTNMTLRPRRIVGEWHGSDGRRSVKAILQNLGYRVETSNSDGFTGLFFAEL